jgi:hypothetical protein
MNLNRWHVLIVIGLLGCSEATGGSGEAAGSGTGSGTGAGGGGGDGTGGVALAVAVPSEGRAFVRLATPEVVEVEGDGHDSAAWDLAFSGYDVHTNGGASGTASGAALGPFEAAVFLSDEAPEFPFLTADRAGGAFLDWYHYDGATHQLYSRYHVHGVRDGDRSWKVQILSYYGEVDGAPTSAMIRLRYAQVEPAAGATEEIVNLDATAGGSGAPEGVPSECLDLGTGQRVALTPEEAGASSAWHLCLRRDAIRVNGELGGPRGVTAVDLDGAATATETPEEIAARTAESELQRFDAVDAAALGAPGLVYRGDRIVSVFSQGWLEPGAEPPAPAAATWLVAGADGESMYLIVFERFEEPGESSPGTVIMRVKPVQ